MHSQLANVRLVMNLPPSSAVASPVRRRDDGRGHGDRVAMLLLQLIIDIRSMRVSDLPSI